MVDSSSDPLAKRVKTSHQTQVDQDSLVKKGLSLGESYIVRNINLGEQGRLNIQLAEFHMEALMSIRKRFEKEKPFQNLRIGMALHVTKETAVLVRTLVAGGATVAITAGNPFSTQDDVAAALAQEGIHVYAYKGETTDDYYFFLNKIIEFKPQVTIDDGLDLATKIHQDHPELLDQIIGGCEETTSGVIRARSMVEEGKLRYPVIAINDNKTKELLDNFYGTGQSAIDGILRATNIFLPGKKFLCVGYGKCGKGIAARARGLGAQVLVSEVDNFTALTAVYDGYQVMPIQEAVQQADIIITATGNKHVLPSSLLDYLKDGVMVCNAGHFENEIDIEGFHQRATQRRTIRPYMEELQIPLQQTTGSSFKRLYILGAGSTINLSAAEGHPSEVMATSFCGQALGTEYLVKNKDSLKKGQPQCIDLPGEIDDAIAGLQLAALGIKIDSLTTEQKQFLHSWTEGTTSNYLA